jgi:hypothetical protein
MYVYEKTGKQVFTVGYYNPKGKFITETVYQEIEEALERVHYLNGGIEPDVFNNVINNLYAAVANLNFLVEDLNQRLDREKKPL